IDANEQKRIFAKIDELALDTEAKAFVFDELRKPLDIDAVVRGATSPEAAIEVYAASALAIDPDDPAEQAYLAMLASRLKLDPGLRASVDQEVVKLRT
ncbi:MAG: tellurite resistance TerB family protein, partial [Rhizobiales bacterium]|nr:tellurite resistance TerB family protein [Hyphomicrobiales bacterium]